MAEQNRTDLKSDVDTNIADSDYNTAADVRGELKDMIDSHFNERDDIHQLPSLPKYSDL